MKHTLHILVRVACSMLLLSTTTLVHADLPQQRKALDELQAAKKTDNPMPLLESAKNRITKANKGNKGGEKEDVLKKINAAIAYLNQGRDKSKRPK